MGLAHIKTMGRLGIRCFPITIEVDVSPGMPAFTIVGLADTIVQEAKERIRAAIKNSGMSFPLARITVNLAPADIKKEGVGFDLPIALGILIADEQLPAVKDSSYFFGELGLQGELKSTRGALSFTLNTPSDSTIFIPLANQYEGRLVEKEHVIPVANLQDLIYFLRGEKDLPRLEKQPFTTTVTQDSIHDFRYIYGQEAAKRALELAAAGHHNVLLSGSPGAGKTLLARSLPSIMPPLSRQELLETTQIYSIAGLLTEAQPIIAIRPFRSPHHSATLVSIIGGSTPPRPGEITLAHNGVLFLDEFAELPRSVIESLRQPLEDRVITVARAGYSAEFPAHCLLIAAINPCPCGYRDDPKHACTCTPQQILQYQKKLSGPILDRIDLHLTVPPVPVRDLSQPYDGEPSTNIRERVMQARDRQETRYKTLGIRTNSELSSRDIAKFCQVDEAGHQLLDKAIDKLKLSARSYHKVLKVARTIADLAGDDTIPSSALAEALHYRPVHTT